jgi:hypothetical protein
MTHSRPIVESGVMIPPPEALNYQIRAGKGKLFSVPIFSDLMENHLAEKDLMC